ncbi:MAG: electron transfer flavoprotein subunit beta/FixA family protein [Acidimicrobiales bacterium]
MDLAVCTKLIPDPATAGVLDPATGRLVRRRPLVLDAADAAGMEMALRLCQSSGGGTVTAVTMAPGGSLVGLRSALAMGATGAVVVTDDALAGSDALATAKVLAAVIGRLHADLVVAGTESTDGYTGTVGVQLAELLSLPSVTFVRLAEVVDGVLVVDRQSQGGVDQVECALPALVTVMAGSVAPRFPTYRGLRAARTAPVELLSVADLGLPVGVVGVAGARQRVVSVGDLPRRPPGVVVVDDGHAHRRILELLERVSVR